MIIDKNYNSILQFICNNEQTIKLSYCLKDNIVTSLTPTSAGSRILRDYTINYDSDIYLFLKNKYSLRCKGNLDSFGCGSSTNTSCFGPVRYTEPVGGSSGGTALNVKLKYVDFGIGSDTGGSIHIPALCCQIMGYKSTRECISRYGLIQYSSTLDSIGLLIRQERASELIDIMNDLNKKGRDINYREYEHDILTSQFINLEEFTKILYLEEDIVELYKIISYSELVSSLQRYQTYDYGDKFINVEKNIKHRIALGSQYIKNGEYDKCIKIVDKARLRKINKVYILKISEKEALSFENSEEDHHPFSLSIYMNIFNLPRFTFKLDGCYHMAFGPRYHDVAILQHLLTVYDIDSNV